MLLEARAADAADGPGCRGGPQRAAQGQKGGGARRQTTRDRQFLHLGCGLAVSVSRDRRGATAPCGAPSRNGVPHLAPPALAAEVGEALWTPPRSFFSPGPVLGAARGGEGEEEKEKEKEEEKEKEKVNVKVKVKVKVRKLLEAKEAAKCEEAYLATSTLVLTPEEAELAAFYASLSAEELLRFSLHPPLSVRGGRGRGRRGGGRDPGDARGTFFVLFASLFVDALLPLLWKSSSVTPLEGVLAHLLF